MVLEFDYKVYIHTTNMKNYCVNNINITHLIEKKRLGLESLDVKNTDCSYRGLEFNSQQGYGGSQPSVMRSDTLFCCV